MARGISTTAGDGDGMADWEEFIAATDPSAPASRLEVNIEPVATDRVALSWQGAQECSYRVESSTNLLETIWTPVTSMQGVTGLMTHTNDSPASQHFYQARAQR